MGNITPKEAIANLNHIYGMVSPDIQRSLDVAIKALERPQVTVFAEDADEKAIEDMKAELQSVIDNERPQGEWELHGMIYYCSECGHDCGESGNNFCGNCGADMRKGGAE